MSNTHKSGSKKPRRRYFRRGSASDPKTSGSKPSSESGSSEKPEGSSGSEGRPENRTENRTEKRTESRSESRSSRRIRAEKRRNRDERSGAKGQRSGGGGLRRRSNSDARRRRQKRRRGELEQAEKAIEQVASGPSIIEAIEREYKPPEAVYTYTHIVRADQRDAYEFRSDHFSHTSLHLEDYAIDLSPILTETGEIALKKFFQDIPSEEDLDATDLERPPREPVKHSNARPATDDIQDSIGDDFEIGFDALFEESFQDTSGADFEEGFEEGEEKSLEQIYDELEMFK